MCTDLLGGGHRQCGWKPGGSFDGEAAEDVATATRRDTKSRLDEAGLLTMEVLAADRAPYGALHQRGTVWTSHAVAFGWTWRPSPAAEQKPVIR